MPPLGIVPVGLNRGDRGHLAAGVVQRRQRVDVPAPLLPQVVDLLPVTVGVPDLGLLARVVRRVRHRVLHLGGPGQVLVGRAAVPAHQRVPGRRARPPKPAAPRSGRPGSRSSESTRRASTSPAVAADALGERRPGRALERPASRAPTARSRSPARPRAAAARFRCRGGAPTAAGSHEQVQLPGRGSPARAAAAEVPARDAARRSSRRPRAIARSGTSGCVDPAAAAGVSVQRRPGGSSTAIAAVARPREHAADRRPGPFRPIARCRMPTT